MTKQQPANWQHYLWQSAIAFVFVFIVLLLFRDSAKSTVLWAIGVSSLSSSAFIVFTKPFSQAAEPRRVIMAYFINIAIGVMMHYLVHYVLGQRHMFSNHGFYIFAILTSFGMILSLLLMLFMQAGHPPAIGINIILIIDMSSYYIIAVITVSALFLALLHLCLRPWLRDLSPKIKL